jgi:hypothetical protein
MIIMDETYFRQRRAHRTREREGGGRGRERPSGLDGAGEGVDWGREEEDREAAEVEKTARRDLSC